MIPSIGLRRGHRTTMLPQGYPMSSYTLKLETLSTSIFSARIDENAMRMWQYWGGEAPKYGKDEKYENVKKSSKNQ